MVVEIASDRDRTGRFIDKTLRFLILQIRENHRPGIVNDITIAELEQRRSRSRQDGGRRQVVEGKSILVGDRAGVSKNDRSFVIDCQVSPESGCIRIQRSAGFHVHHHCAIEIVVAVHSERAIHIDGDAGEITPVVLRPGYAGGHADRVAAPVEINIEI